MPYVRILIVTMFTFCLLSCQAGNQESGPRAIVDWQPTPLASRTPLPALEEDTAAQEQEPALSKAVVEPVQTTNEEAESTSIIPTLAPTPIPDGIFVRESDGFEVVYPTSWEVGDSGGFGVQLYDPGFGLFVNAYSEMLEEESSYEAMIEEFQNEVSFLTDITVESEEEFPFGDEGIIKVATLTGIDEEGEELAVRLAYMEDGNRAKQLVVFGLLEDLQAREATLNAMIGQAKPGGTQVFGLDRQDTIILLGGDPLPIHLDPALTTGGAGGYVGLLYRGLVHLTPELQIVPDLAESWSVSDDGTVYTFTLRDGLTFESGQSLTAADVKNSWERASDPDTGSTTASTYLSDILGAKEMLNGEAESISGLVVVDPRILEVTLDGPKPYFLAKLTYPTSFIVDLESVDEEKAEWIYSPNASGPYTLSDFREGEALIFERNDAYYEPGTISNVVYLLYRIGTGTSLFESNEVDVVYLNAIESQEVRLASNPLHDQWQSTTSLCTSLVQINNTMPPMDDANVRRAFALSVNREALNELLSEGMDLEASTILPPAMPGYSLDLADASRGNGYDLDAARAALAESAYANGLPPIVLLNGGYGDTEDDEVNMLVDGWHEVLGAEVSVEYVDPENYSEAVRNSSGHLVSYGWCADYPDPQNFLDILYQGESEFNVAGYSNEDIDALLEDAGNELDPKQRLKLYQDIEVLLLEDYAAIPLRHYISDILVNSRVKGYVLSPINDSPINSLSIEMMDGE